MAAPLDDYERLMDAFENPPLRVYNVNGHPCLYTTEGHHVPLRSITIRESVDDGLPMLTIETLAFRMEQGPPPGAHARALPEGA